MVVFWTICPLNRCPLNHPNPTVCPCLPFMSGYAPSCGTQSETSFSQTFLWSQCHFPKISLISLQNNTVCPTHGTCKECNLIHTTKCILCDRFTISATLSFVIRIFYVEEKRRTFRKSKQHTSFCDPRNHRNEKPITYIAQILALTDDILSCLSERLGGPSRQRRLYPGWNIV